MMKKFNSLLTYIGAFLLTLWILTPIAWMLLISLENQSQIFLEPSMEKFFPITFENYIYLFVGGTDFVRTMINSSIIATIASILATIIGTMAAYAIQRLPLSTRVKNNIFFWIVSQRITPFLAVIIPFYILYSQTGLYDTYYGMVLAYLLFTIPFTVFSMVGYLNEIPKEIDEAALIDGCSRIGILYRVILPICRAGIVTVALLNFALCWNELLMALILTGEHARTVAVAAALFLPSAGRGAMWGPAAAIGIFFMLPVLLLSVFIRKNLIRGLTMGIVKG
jgi:multiple sugar transport system permease protein